MSASVYIVTQEQLVVGVDIAGIEFVSGAAVQVEEAH